MNSLRLVTVCALSFAVSLSAAEPAGFRHWKASELKGYEKSLAAKMDPKLKIGTERFGNFGANSSAQISHREADGEAEIHEFMVDYFVVQSGQATLVVGGKLAAPRQTGHGELRAPGISGGERVELKAGDIVTIPANTPHQLLVAKGSQFTYFVIKTTK
jgi:mannose-6-phosphate isomerase-like protein (cupin superfamily)